MNKVRAGEPPIFGDGEPQRAFSFVGGIRRRASENRVDQEIYGKVSTVGDDHPYTVNRLAGEMSKRSEISLQRPLGRKASVWGQAETPLSRGPAQIVHCVRIHGAQKIKSFGKFKITRDWPQKWLEE